MYFMMMCKDPLDHDLATISYHLDDPWRSWLSGSRFLDNPPAPSLPVTAYVEKFYAGDIPELENAPLAFLSKRLASVLISVGVDNIDYYQLEITDELTGRVDIDHLAFNLIGTIAAADLNKTKFSEFTLERIISADIESLVIDEKKTKGALMFRLAESVNGIVVHESVKNAIEAAGIDTLTFIPPEEWVG